MSTTTTDKPTDETNRFRPLIERVYHCETCGNEITTPGTMDGDECPRWDCNGGPVLSEQTKRATDRLMEGPSETCIRLARYARGEHWNPSTETFLQPLKATDGDILIRMSVDHGAYWLYYAGTPLETDFFRCVSALPHFHDHKLTSVIANSPSRIADILEDNVAKPIHIENVPVSVLENLSTSRAYEGHPEVTAHVE